MVTKTVNLPVQTRSLDAMPASINEELRTLEVVWTTETPVERWDFWSGERYMEVLDLGDESVNMERMNTRAPLLDSHTQWGTDGVIGVVERAWLENRKGLAVVRFLKDDERADKVWNKVRQGVLNKISVGYSIEEFEETFDNSVRTLRAVRWTPLEISIVAVPADNDAAVRSADKRASACVIKTRANTAKKNKPKQFKRKEHKSMKKRFKRQIEDLAPEQVAEVAGIVDDEAEQINTAVEEAVTALDAEDIAKCGIPMAFYSTPDNPEIEKTDINAMVILGYIVRLAGIPKSSAMQMCARDFLEAQNIIIGFFGEPAPNTTGK